MRDGQLSVMIVAETSQFSDFKKQGKRTLLVERNLNEHLSLLAR